MTRLISIFVLVLLIAAPAFGPALAQQSLVGTYKIVSHEVEREGTAIRPLGEAPHGYLVLTPTRYIAFYTGGDRKFGVSEPEKAALLDTLTGVSGVYRVEGSKIIISVDASWTEAWTGKDQVRNWTLSGNRLTLTSDPVPSAMESSKTSIIRAVWEKIE